MAEKLEVIITGKDELSGILRGVGNVALGVAAGGIAALGAGLVGLGVFINDSIQSAMESQNVLAQLNAVLTSTGGVAGVTAQQATDLATSLQKVTRYSDEAVLGGENLLLTFTNIGQDIFPQATGIMLDMSTALGQDVKSSAIQLGKALQDPILGVTALRRVGVNFNEEDQKMIKNLVETGRTAEAQKFIMAELTKEFGGAAEAAGNTFAGKLDILKNQFDDVKESVGLKLIPVLSELMDKVIIPMMPVITDLAMRFGDFIVKVAQSPEFQTLVTNIGNILTALLDAGPASIEFKEAVGGALQNLIPPELQTAFNFLTQWWQTNGPGIQAAAQQLFGDISSAVSQVVAQIGPFVNEVLVKLITWFTENGPLIQAFAMAIAQSFTDLVPAIVAVWGVIQPVLMGLLDLILGIARIIMQVATGDWPGAWETLKQTVINVGNAIGTAIVGFLDLIAKTMGGSLAQIGTMWSANWNQLKQIFSTIWNLIIAEFNDKINKVKGFIEDVAQAFGNISAAVRDVVDWIATLAGKLAKLVIPKWLQPGSPTPFEIGLRGIKSAMQDLSGVSAPIFNGTANMALTGVSAIPGGGSGPIVVQLNISSPVTILDEQKVRDTLTPLIIEGVRQAQANGVIGAR